VFSWILRYLMFRLLLKFLWRLVLVAAAAAPFVWSTAQAKYHEYEKQWKVLVGAEPTAPAAKPKKERQKQ
jgi:hypothetical protein